jgi:hypothetical protein
MGQRSADQWFNVSNDGVSLYWLNNTAILNKILCKFQTQDHLPSFVYLTLRGRMAALKRNTVDSF